MVYLYEQLDTLRKAGVVVKIPKYIPDNLNANFELCPYQTEAFENFLF